MHGLWLECQNAVPRWQVCAHLSDCSELALIHCALSTAACPGDTVQPLDNGPAQVSVKLVQEWQGWE